MSESEEQQLWDACTEGNLELVNLLANDLAVNVNWIGPEKELKDNQKILNCPPGRECPKALLFLFFFLP